MTASMPRLGPSSASSTGSRPIPTLASDPEASRLKMEAFRKVKPICVRLMSLAATPPTSFSDHYRIIDTLSSSIKDIPPTAFTPSMINYLLFPIIQILRNNDPRALTELFLESAYRFLAIVVNVWKKADGGMDIGAWEQLWRFCIASMGTGLDGGKGKGKQVGQEVQLQAALLLQALLQPTVSEPSGTRTHPSIAMLEKVSSPKSPLMPTLFQTITFLLLTLDSPLPKLHLASLSLLRPLVTTYLHNQHPVLASVLPGMVSSISKLVNSAKDGKPLRGDVVVEALGLLQDVVVETLSDEDLRNLGVLGSGVDNLSQFGDEWESQMPNSNERPSSPTPSIASTANGSTAGKRPDPFPPLSRSYLDFTSSQLFTAIRPILLQLASHPSHLAPQAVSRLCTALIRRTSESLPSLVQSSLSNLLLLCQDDFDAVSADARAGLRSLLVNPDGSPNSALNDSVVSVLGDTMNALPRLITSHQESKVTQACRLLQSIAELSSESSVRPGRGLVNPIAELLGPKGNIARWSWSLLSCLEFGRPAGWSTTGSNVTAARASEKGWQGHSILSSIPLLIEGSGEGSEAQDGGKEFPSLPLRYVESGSTIKTIRQALESLGYAGGESALFSVEYLVTFARSHKRNDVSKAVSALWVAQHLLEGITRGQEESSEGRIGKRTRKLAKDVTKLLVAIDDEGEEDYDDSLEPKAEEVSDALIPVERTKGLDTITTLLDAAPKTTSYASSETRRLHAQAQAAIFTSLSLSTLSTTSRILSSSFRPLLLTALYTLLQHITSPHPLISSYAETALINIAYNTGYASVQNLILDNVDYVINVVSQHLTPGRLSSSAPLVLISMIRLTRGSSDDLTIMIHDIIDEIFDVLDDYHGYEILTSGLLAVLSTLVEVMNEDVGQEGISEERAKRLREMDRVNKAPDPVKDFAKFETWYRDRQTRREEQIEDIIKRAPQQPWSQNLDVNGNAEQLDAEAPAKDVQVGNNEEEQPPTRTQEVCAQIIEKSLNFLSHKSPFLRARILNLIAKAIPVLANGNREADLLPLIDRSWSILLLRLEDTAAFVSVEAIEVVVSLCENVGDFMSRRILDAVWPRITKLLSKQFEQDSQSALSRRTAGGRVIGTESKYTTSHRFYLSVISVANFIVKSVPVNDNLVFKIMVMMRPCLDERVHEEIQARAMGLYGELSERDGDALWLVLRASTGSMPGEEGGEEGIWAYLKDEHLRIQKNAQILLDRM